MSSEENQYQRTELLIGKEGLKRLHKASVCIFGLGGVGSFAAEALCRAGIGKFLLVDGDKISISNINRQLIATHSTIGRYKAEAMGERMADINPNTVVNIRNEYFTAENQQNFDFSCFSYCVDAIDMVTSKLLLISLAKSVNVPIITSMGTGNKLNPQGFLVDDISRTSVCPLAKVMRKECKDRELTNVKVVYSKELPIKPAVSSEPLLKGKGQIPGSISFVPASAGLLLAGEVIKDIIYGINR